MFLLEMIMMQVPSITIQTFLKVFIVHGIIFGSFTIIGFMILKRSRNWLHVIVSGFYLSFATGLFINFIFVLLSFDPNEQIVLMLYYSTMFFLLLGTFFLTIFLLILWKSEDFLKKQWQVLLLIIYSIVTLLMVFIPNGVSINGATNWNPVYNINYFLYLFIIFSAFSVIPQIYYFFKIYNKFEDNTLRKRLKLFMIGTLMIYALCYGTLIYNFLDIQELRLIWGYFSLVLSIAGAICIYFGIVKF